MMRWICQELNLHPLQNAVGIPLVQSAKPVFV